MDRKALAKNTFQEGFSCSQSIIYAFADLVELDKETALKLGSGFSGGIGRTGSVCGAVSGAVCILGLKYGITDSDDTDGKNKMYDLVQEFKQKFEEKHKTTICNDLIGHDINDPDDREKAAEKQIFTTICPQYVYDAAEILNSMLND